jgi:GTP cyclohydrolase IA
MAIDHTRAENAIRSLLEALDYDPNQPELRDTPRLVVEAYLGELLAGRGVDLASLLKEGSFANQGSHDLVVVRELSVVTICPHHLLPAMGRATVAYLPGARLLGLGTLARLVDAASRQLAFQESIGRKVVDALMTHGEARGAYCELRLEHACLRARGARATEAEVQTLHLAGDLDTDGAARHLVGLIRGGAGSHG